MMKLKKMMSLILVGSMMLSMTMGGSVVQAEEGKHINAALAWMEPGLDPSNGTYGWVTVRMGVTECLVKMNDKIEIEPWIASDVKNIDELTWEITIRDGVTFSNGTPVTAEVVKQCYERTLELSTRAVNLSKIASMEADGQVLTVTTSEPNGAFKANL